MTPTPSIENQKMMSLCGLVILVALAWAFSAFVFKSIDVPHLYFNLKPLELSQERQLRTRLSKEQQDAYLNFFQTYQSPHTLSSTYVLELPGTETDSSETLVVVADYPNFDYGRMLAIADTSNMERTLFGDELPFSQRGVSFRLPMFKVHGAKQGELIVIQAIDTIQNEFGINVYTEQNFQQYTQYNMFIYGLYFGVLLLLIAVSLFLFYFARQAHFLWYSSYLSFCVVFLLTANGLGSATLWTEQFATTRYSFWAACGMAVFITLFARSFIGRSNVSPWFWSISKINMAALLSISASLFFVHHGVIDSYFFFFVFLQMSIMFGLAVQAYLREHKHAVFLILGYIVLFPGLVLSILKFSGLVEVNQIVNHAVEVSLLLEALLFSLGLGYKLQSLTEAEREVRRTREEYLNELITVREEEKRDMAVYLHNSVAQLVALIKRKLSKLEDMRTIPELNEIGQLTDQAMQKLRAISHDTYPHMLVEFGLANTVQHYAEIHLEEADIDFKLCIDDSNLSDRQSLLLYRIFQECINNVVRHANASRILLSLKYENGRHQLSFEDDGDGFDPSEFGFGIATIREYTQALGGALDITSEMRGGAIFRTAF